MISQRAGRFLDLINEHGDLDPLFPATRSYHLLAVKCDKNVCQQNRTSERTEKKKTAYKATGALL